MNKNNIKQAIHIASIIKEGNTYTKADAYIGLLKCARALSLNDTRSCNGDVSADTYTKRNRKTHDRIKQIISDTGLHYFHQGDPRGASLYIWTQPMTGENYNNGIAIY